jgi:hypothetical protein
VSKTSGGKGRADSSRANHQFPGSDWREEYGVGPSRRSPPCMWMGMAASRLWSARQKQKVALERRCTLHASADLVFNRRESATGLALKSLALALCLCCSCFLVLHPSSPAVYRRPVESILRATSALLRNRIAGDILLQGLPYYKVPCE